MNYDSWRTNEDPHWMRNNDHDNDTDNDSLPPRAEGILACGHCYCDYCKCNDNNQLETELQDYHWRNL